LGVSCIKDVEDHAHHSALKGSLNENKREHERLQNEVDSLLHKYGDEGKDPNPMAKGMSHLKCQMRLMGQRGDREVASLITDGCNMGVKSLSRYLNQYAAADERSKDIAKRLIALEERLSVEMRSYL
jgi:hypothetical protein